MHNGSAEAGLCPAVRTKVGRRMVFDDNAAASIVSRYASGETASGIAVSLSVCHGAIASVLKSAGLITNRRYTPKERYPFIKDGVVVVPATGGISGVADIQDFDLIRSIPWSNHRDGYLRGKVDGKPTI